jgi:flagellar biosynthesis anti-sigma factor FlgM
MKIDSYRPATDTQASDGTGRTGKDVAVRPGAGVVTAPSSDRVELSDEATLRVKAFKAASDSPNIRTELVDRMREKLNAGKVGHDAGALADAMIADLLK